MALQAQHCLDPQLHCQYLKNHHDAQPPRHFPTPGALRRCLDGFAGCALPGCSISDHPRRWPQHPPPRCRRQRTRLCLPNHRYRRLRRRPTGHRRPTLRCHRSTRRRPRRPTRYRRQIHHRRATHRGRRPSQCRRRRTDHRRQARRRRGITIRATRPTTAARPTAAAARPAAARPAASATTHSVRAPQARVSARGGPRRVAGCNSSAWGGAEPVTMHGVFDRLGRDGWDRNIEGFAATAHLHGGAWKPHTCPMRGRRHRPCRKQGHFTRISWEARRPTAAYRSSRKAWMRRRREDDGKRLHGGGFRER